MVYILQEKEERIEKFIRKRRVFYNMKEEIGVSRNLLAILLIIAILLSITGTYIAIYNANVVKVIDVGSSVEGMVGVYVDNPEMPEVLEGGG